MWISGEGPFDWRFRSCVGIVENKNTVGVLLWVRKRVNGYKKYIHRKCSSYPFVILALISVSKLAIRLSSCRSLFTFS